SVVAGPALVEVVQRELEPEGRDRVVAHAHLAVVERVTGIVAVLEELRAVHQRVARVLSLARARRHDERGGEARAREERPVDDVGERIVELDTPGPGLVRDLDRPPVARVPVPLEEILRERPDVPEVVEELEHPEWTANL